MGLETASFITDLNSAWPLATDERRQGDDHLRLLKACLQAQFPNLGSTAAVLPTEVELNYMQGVTSNVQTQLDSAAQIEVGQQFLCRASALPVNGKWTLVTSVNDVVPLISSSLGTTESGGWQITGLSAGTTGATNLSSHAHTGGAVTHTGPSYIGAGGALSSAAGNNGESFGHTVNNTGSTDLGSHSHPGSAITAGSSWRPANMQTVILEYTG